MSSIRQACPACARLLELPQDAVGRLGKCPACDATFTIGEIIDATVAPAHDPHIREDSGPAVPQTISNYQTPGTLELTSGSPDGGAQPFDESSGNESPGKWQDASQHPFAVPLGAGTTEPVPDAAYIAASQPIPRSLEPIAESQSRPTSIEAIILPTFSIFGERWPPMVISFLIGAATIGFLTAFPAMVISNLSDAGGDVAALVLALIWVPLLVAVVCGVCVGLARVAIATAANTSPSPMSQLVSPLSLVVRFLVSALLLSVVIGAIALAFAALMAMLAAAAGNNQVATLVTVLSTIVLALGLLLAGWLFWAWPLIVSDGRGTALGSLKSAVALTMNQKLTSALMVLIAVVLTAIGTLMCNVGHFVTGPITVLMFTVAYLQMTGRKIDEPQS